MLIFPRIVLKVSAVMVLLFLLIITRSANDNQVIAQSPTSDFSKVDAYINETMRRLPIDGVALAVVKGDQILYMQGYGIANAQGDPATPQTPWPMGSVTKSFTALAIRQLAVAEKVDLDAPLQSYLPEFQLADKQAASLITIRELLDHTSGISNDEGEAPYLNSPKTTFAEDLDRLAEYRPEYQPGEHAEYSNWNYVLLSQVVTRVSGQSYTDYVKENIFTPLGMSSSTFAEYNSVPHAATGNLITFGLSVPYVEKFVPGMTGAANLTSTSEDMAHFLSLFLGKGIYHNKSLLPATGSGSYAPMWDWIQGVPSSNVVYGLSGGLNSISTTCLTYPKQEVGVVLLLNTRLDQLSSVSSYELALGIGNIILHRPYQFPSSFALYKPWIILDGAVLLLIAVFVWQVSRLRGWKIRYLYGKGTKKGLVWVGIVFILLICFAIFSLPSLLGTRWNTLIFMRPDLGIPLIVIALLLGIIGLFKAFRIFI